MISTVFADSYYELDCTKLYDYRASVIAFVRTAAESRGLKSYATFARMLLASEYIVHGDKETKHPAEIAKRRLLRTFASSPVNLRVGFSRAKKIVIYRRLRNFILRTIKSPT